MKPSFMEQIQAASRQPKKTLVDQVAPYHEKTFAEKLAMAASTGPEVDPAEKQLEKKKRDLEAEELQIKLNKKQQEQAEAQAEEMREAEIEQLRQQQEIQMMAQNPGQMMPMQPTAAGRKACAIQALIWRAQGHFTE